MIPSEQRIVYEIPFDVAVWGDREVEPLYHDDAERERSLTRPKPAWWPELVATADRLREERLARD
jgi:hypothetical protein